MHALDVLIDEVAGLRLNIAAVDAVTEPFEHKI
jgi:hypothetical protein